MSHLDFCPAGVVLPFAGRVLPDGWLWCDGTEISKTAYARLYSSLISASGTSGVYDTQIDPTTGNAYASPSAGNFRLPDYRGLFLRGVGTAIGGDASVLGQHQGQKTAKNGLSATANATQSTTLTNHGHGVTDPKHSHSFGPLFRDSAFADNNMPPRGSNAPVTGYAGTSSELTGITVNSANIDHTHGTTISGDNETRPVNKGINYIIKI